jgi:hypothetical protein
MKPQRKKAENKDSSSAVEDEYAKTYGNLFFNFYVKLYI